MRTIDVLEDWTSRGIELPDATSCRTMLRGLQMDLAEIRNFLLSIYRRYPAVERDTVVLGWIADDREEARRLFSGTKLLRRRLRTLGTNKAGA